MNRIFLLLTSALFSQAAMGQQWLGSSTSSGAIYRGDKIKVGYGPLYLDWTYNLNWGGNASQWAGYVGFNAFRYNNEPKDYYWGENQYTSKGVFEGHYYGFRWLFRLPSGNDSNGQHQLSELMTLTHEGKLGIGTTAPDSKLTVKGDIHTREVKVDLAGAVGPDYVFEKDYPLTSLEELKSYIDQNKHLPEIPSAREMEENGINLKEMNLLLLKKVEELTLHLIEQNNQLKKSQMNAEVSSKKVEELTLYLIELEKKNREQDELINNLINNHGY